MNLRVDLNADLGEGAGHDDEIVASGELRQHCLRLSCWRSTCRFSRSIRAARENVASRWELIQVSLIAKILGEPRWRCRQLRFSQSVAYQLGAFHALAVAAGARVNHVKAHGALYNMAVRDEKLAEAIAHAVLAVDSSLLFFAPGESILERAAQSVNLRVVREVFADRNYLADGSLVPRTRSDAFLHDPEEAAQRVIRMLREGVVRSVEGKDVEVQAETICVHGDTPGAVDFVRALRARLEAEGVLIEAPGSSK